MPLAHEILVRPARLNDVESIVGFSAAMALETEGRRLDLAQLREGTLSLFSTPAYGFFMVAEPSHAQQPQLIGQLMITYEWSDWRNGVFWWIQSVYVHTEWRRQGVFKQMHQAVLQEARGRTDVCGVRLYVDKNNPIAQSTYERLGMTRSAYQIYESDFVIPSKPLKE